VAPANNSLRDILMGRDSSIFEQRRVKADLKAAEVRDQNKLKGDRAFTAMAISRAASIPSR